MLIQSQKFQNSMCSRQIFDPAQSIKRAHGANYDDPLSKPWKAQSINTPTAKLFSHGFDVALEETSKSHILATELEVTRSFI